MIFVEQVHKITGICSICGSIIHDGQIMTLILPQNDRPRRAHLYCYVVMRKRRQRQEQREKALPPS